MFEFLQDTKILSLLVICIVMICLCAFHSYSKTELPVHNYPTLPKYLIQKPRYYASMGLFALVPSFCLIVLLLYREHLGLFADFLVRQFNIPGLDGIDSDTLNKINEDPQSAIIIVTCIIILILRIEKAGNPLIFIRDRIYKAASMPLNARHIANLAATNVALDKEKVKSVLKNTLVESVTQRDFEFSRNTIEYKWAVSSYYIYCFEDFERNESYGSFFSNTYFGWDDLKKEYLRQSILIKSYKNRSIKLNEQQNNEIRESVDALLNKLTRLLACFLFYTNNTQSSMWVMAQNIGVGIDQSVGIVKEHYFRIPVLELIFCIFTSIFLGSFLGGLIYDLIWPESTSLMSIILQFASNIDKTPLLWGIWSIMLYAPPILFFLYFFRKDKINQDKSISLWGNSLIYFVLSYIYTACVLFIVTYLQEAFQGDQPIVQGCSPKNRGQRVSLALMWAIPTGVFCGYFIARLSGLRLSVCDRLAGRFAPVLKALILSVFLMLCTFLVTIISECKMVSIDDNLSPGKFWFVTIFASGLLGFCADLFAQYLNHLKTQNLQHLSEDEIKKLFTGLWGLEERYAHGEVNGKIEIIFDNNRLIGKMQRKMSPVRGNTFDVSNDVNIEFEHDTIKMTTISGTLIVGEHGPDDFKPDMWVGRLNEDNTISGRVFDDDHISGSFKVRRDE